MKIISGKYRRRKLYTPSKTSNMRPSYARAKEVTFNILMHQRNCFIDDQPALYGKVADIFAGTGSLGIECLSRGAESVFFIDNDPDAIELIKKNLKMLNESTNCCYQANALFLGESNIQYDLILLDPPYFHQLGEKIIKRLKTKKWISDKTIIFIKLPKKEEFNLPEEFMAIDDRICGSARLLFIKLKT